MLILVKIKTVTKYIGTQIIKMQNWIGFDQIAYSCGGFKMISRDKKNVDGLYQRCQHLRIAHSHYGKLKKFSFPTDYGKLEFFYGNVLKK